MERLLLLAVSLLASAFLLIAIGAAKADENTFAISCDHTSQIDFNDAARMMSKDQLRARSMFQDLLHRDPNCPILYWGLARTATSRQQRDGNILDAILGAVETGVDRAEWTRISSLDVRTPFSAPTKPSQVGGE